MTDLGNIKIADEVVKTITAKAALEVEGVYKLAGGVVDEFSKILGKKRPTNGVKVEIGETECNIDISLIVEYGFKIADVAENVQKSVAQEVSEITGLKVIEVNVFVQNVKIIDDSTTDEEIITTL